MLPALDQLVGLSEVAAEQRELGLVDGHMPVRGRQPQLVSEPRGHGEPRREPRRFSPAWREA